jgi:DNA-binding NarL/FixJ family response regulator
MSCVLIVEDQAPLRQHARNTVEATLPAPVQIMDASNGVDGLKLAAALDPDLIIMDISMPEMSGIKVAQQIWKEVPHRRILFWSQFHREAYVRELGRIVPDEAIHGYALKGESDEKFRAAIVSVLLHNNPYIDPVVRSVQSRLACKDDSLSDSEYEALMDVVVGLTDKAIARRRHISVRGVQNRLSMLLIKLVKGEDSHLKESAQIEIYNPRTRIIFEGLKRGLLDPDDIKSMDNELLEWLSSEYDYERSGRN